MGGIYVGGGLGEIKWGFGGGWGEEEEGGRGWNLMFY